MATNKIDIEGIFSLASEEDILAFCKAYALSHTSFAEALQKRFAPEEKNVAMTLADFKKEIEKCYTHEMSKPRWYDSYNSYEPDFLDWELVGKSLLRVIKKAHALVKTSNADLAVEVALIILKKNAIYFENDYLCDREDWDEDDMHIVECLEIIRDALAIGNLPKERMLKVADELEQLDRDMLYSDYFDGDMETLVDDIRASLLTDEERLKVLIRNFNCEVSSWRHSSLACDIWKAMIEMNKEKQAVDFFRQHEDIVELREEYVKFLLDKNKKEEALAIVNEGIVIAKKNGHIGTEYSWIDRKLDIYKTMKDKENIIKTASFLFVQNCNRMDKYHLLKKTVAKDEWDDFLEGLFAKCDISYSATSTFADIYKEEKKYQNLYELVMKANRDTLSALEKYGKYFTTEQQNNVVKKVEEWLLHYTFAMTRKGYQELSAIHLRLANTCAAGHETAKKSIQHYITMFPKRPALREELQKVLRKIEK